ncbi:hypothetical protein P355_3018 [Burkholderia cenocepacia KC-01]|nr:hypothetical protein P355_3018 [Burkholderia cenocepacia KC-01]
MRAALSACSSAADDALFHRPRVIDVVDALPKYSTAGPARRAIRRAERSPPRAGTVRGFPLRIPPFPPAPPSVREIAKNRSRRTIFFLFHFDFDL